VLLGGAAIVAIVGVVFVAFHRSGSSSTAAITALSSLGAAGIGGIAGWLTGEARGTQTASIHHPTITLTPNTGSAANATQFTVNGSGFASGEAVHITFGATALTAATASQGGGFAQAQTVPAGATQGEPVVVTATGQTSSAVATAAFNVT
jgi:hypothetical protein